MKEKICVFTILMLAVGAVAAVADEPPPPEPLTVKVAKGVDLNLYGKVKMDLVYDTAQFKFYNDFIGCVANRFAPKDTTTYAVDPADPTKVIATVTRTYVPQDYGKDSTNFNPRDSRLGLAAKAALGNWVGKAKIEMDFYGDINGNNLLPRLRLGFVDIGYTPWKLSVLAGQDWDPVSQLNPNVSEFGLLAASGNLWNRVPQATARKALGSNFEALFSVLKQRRTDTASNDLMPWFLARLGSNFELSSVKGMLAIGGGYRNADYGTATVPPKDSGTQRWLIAEETKFIFGDFMLQGEFWYGDGVDGEFLRYDLDVNTVTNKTIVGIGGWGDLTWNITPKLSTTAGYGIDDPLDSEMMAGRTPAQLNDRQFTRNQSIYWNFWYRIISPLRVGLEVIHVDTTRSTYTDSGWRFNTAVEMVF